MAASASTVDATANAVPTASSTCHEPESPPESGSQDQRMAARGSHWSFLEKARFEAALHKYGPFAWRAIIRAVGTRSEKQVKAYAARYRRRKKLAARAAMEAYQESVNVHQQILSPNDRSSAIAVAPAPIAGSMAPHVATAANGMPMHGSGFPTPTPAQCHAAALFLTPVPIPLQGAPSTTSTVSSCSTLTSPKLIRSLKKGRRSASTQTSPSRLSQPTHVTGAKPEKSVVKTESGKIARVSLSSSAATSTPRISSDVPLDRCRASLESNSSSTTTKADDITQTLMLLQQSLQTAKLEKHGKVREWNKSSNDERIGQCADMGANQENREAETLPSLSSYDLMMKQVAADMSRPTLVTRVDQDEDVRMAYRNKAKCEAAHISEGVLDDDEIMSENNGDLLLPQFGNNGYDGAVTAYNTMTNCNDPYFYLP